MSAIPTTEPAALAAIRDSFSAAQEIKPLEARQKAAAIVIRAYLADAHESLITDGEYGLEARLSTYETAGTFDWATMDDHAILELARAGALQAAPKTTLDGISKALPRIGEIIRKHRMPGGEQSRLIIGARK